MRMLGFLAVALVAWGCPPAPEKDYTVDEVGQLESLTEIMRLQAQVADPLFAIRDQDTFSTEELRAMEQAGPRIEATAGRVREHFVGQGAYDEGFGEWADKLREGAVMLTRKAKNRDAKGAREALEAMKAACAGCHANY